LGVDERRVRARKMGSNTLVDIRIQIKPDVPASAANQVVEAVRWKIRQSMPEVSEVLVTVASGVSKPCPFLVSFRGADAIEADVRESLRGVGFGSAIPEVEAPPPPPPEEVGGLKRLAAMAAEAAEAETAPAAETATAAAETTASRVYWPPLSEAKAAGPTTAGPGAAAGMAAGMPIRRTEALAAPAAVAPEAAPKVDLGEGAGVGVRRVLVHYDKLSPRVEVLLEVPLPTATTTQGATSGGGAFAGLAELEALGAKARAAILSGVADLGDAEVHLQLTAVAEPEPSQGTTAGLDVGVGQGTWSGGQALRG